MTIYATFYIIKHALEKKNQKIKKDLHAMKRILYDMGPREL